MKKLILLPITLFCISSCSEIKQIGSLQVVSTKSLVCNQFESLALPTYKNKEIRKKAKNTIDQAIDVELSLYSGSTHMINVKIYQVDKMFGAKFSVIGEVVKCK